MISTSAVDTYIQSNSRRFVDELKELCSFPSISNNGLDAIKPARDWIANRLAGFTDRVETFDAGGMPALYAEVKGAGRRKLLLYEHYDVQPVDPIDQWEADPFKAVEKDGRLVARGVADDKADVMARIHAVEVLKHLGEIPVTLRFLVEGEEEIGSKTFEKIAHKHADKLKADGCLWESGGFDSADRPMIFFGVRGLLYIQLRGFYDDVVPPTEADRKMLAKIDPEVDERKRLIGFDEMIRNPSPDKVVEQLLFTPTCNIAGVTTGYQGPGSKTVLPAEATAKLDFRLIPNQDPTDILSKLRRHLDGHGFEKVEIVWSDGEKPVRSDPSSDIGKVMVESVRELHGEPVIWPFMQATGPMHPVVADLGIPTVMPVGVGRPENRIHAPNENIRVDDYLNTIRLMCRVWERFGAAG